jgi:hypothetical protein
MITLHFTVSNYSEEFIELALCAKDKVLTSQQILRSAWEKNENNLRDYWRFKLITEVKKDIEGWQPKYELPKDIYDAWHKWYYFIDGEDASEFIREIGRSQHTLHFQSSYAIMLGWKYFKKLKAAKFKTSTAAILAYTRGYLGGMDANNRYKQEGTEALSILGLQTLPDTNLVD